LEQKENEGELIECLHPKGPAYAAPSICERPDR
jgi:hypothetical protein